MIPEPIFVDTNVLIRLLNGDTLIADLAVEVRLTTRLKLMDAIIAATATELGFTLLTADEKFRSHKRSPVVILPPVA